MYPHGNEKKTYLKKLKKQQQQQQIITGKKIQNLEKIWNFKIADCFANFQCM